MTTFNLNLSNNDKQIIAKEVYKLYFDGGISYRGWSTLYLRSADKIYKLSHKDLYSEEYQPSINDNSGYDDFLKYSNLEDNDENYRNFCDSMKDFYFSNIEKSITIDDGDNDTVDIIGIN